MSTIQLKLGSRLLMAAASLAILSACSPEPAKPAEPAAVAAKPSDDQAWPAAAVADPATIGFTAEGLAALDARMAKSVADHDVAGMVTILGKGGDIAQFKAYGVQSGDPATGAPMTTNSMFRIYSMSKPITGTAMMQLYEKGLWQLDDPVSKYVPELANLKVITWKDGKPVIKGGKPVLADPASAPTMRQLMSHTAGFGYGLCCVDPKAPNWNPVDAAFVKDGVLASANLDEMMKKIEAIPLLYDPGTKWSYSAAVDIQGYIVQKLSGQKFGDYLKANVFTPLGMNDTSFFVTEASKPRFTDVYHWDKDKNALLANPVRPDRPGFDDPNRLESGGGGLVSTTHDYARFAQMFLNKGTLGGNQVLKPETVELMRTNHIGTLGVSTDGTRPNGLDGVSFGLDFAIYDEPSKTGQPYAKGTHYWGGAAGTWFWIDPANDLFFVGMIQQMGGFRPDAMNFRADSAKLVYEALKSATAAATAAPAEPAKEPAH
ncbi:MAG: serine hydrolase domain-containing protein [Hyphomonadaceae bacterium]